MQASIHPPAIYIHLCGSEFSNTSKCGARLTNRELGQMVMREIEASPEGASEIPKPWMAEVFSTLLSSDSNHHFASGSAHVLLIASDTDPPNVEDGDSAALKYWQGETVECARALEAWLQKAAFWDDQVHRVTVLGLPVSIDRPTEVGIAVDEALREHLRDTDGFLPLARLVRDRGYVFYSERGGLRGKGIDQLILDTVPTGLPLVLTDPGHGAATDVATYKLAVRSSGTGVDTPWLSAYASAARDQGWDELVELINYEMGS